MKYNVGDLVILKDHAWGYLREYTDKVGMIVKICKDKRLVVRFENDFLPPMLKDRCIYRSDINKHYPVVKV
jgi:hypothetical protein